MNGSILIVAFNNLHLTKQAVKSALEQDVPCDILVINNHSKDGTTEWLRSKRVASITPYTQMSLAWCWNTGINMFWRTGKQVCLVCNNDIEMRPDTFRLLASCNRSFITCVSVGNRKQLGVVGDRTVARLLDGRRLHPDYSCFMIDKSVTDRGLYFDEDYYPAYCEDNDHHVRMHRAGIHACCVDLPFLHLAAQSIKTCSEAERNELMRAAERNRQRFAAKYGCLPGSPEYSDLFKV